TPSKNRPLPCQRKKNLIFSDPCGDSPRPSLRFGRPAEKPLFLAEKTITEFENICKTDIFIRFLCRHFGEKALLSAVFRRGRQSGLDTFLTKPL
ncbi:hypothetical protein, partial [uncultured Desulfovibrio sp.]